MELAKEYNIYGFCYYYYWFNGKRLLNAPLDEVISNKELDLPFCICWANENWTRRWDGLDQEVLISQSHNSDSDKNFILDVIPILKDERYIRVNNSPMLIIYRINLFPEPKKTVQMWREACKSAGIDNICIAIVKSFGIESPENYGCDCAIEFPPHGFFDNDLINNERHNKVFNFHGHIYDYEKVVDKALSIKKPKYKFFRGVMLGWDNTPRRMNKSVIYENFSIKAYERWLKGCVDYCKENLEPNERLVFINAWNEWGEGTYLEPDDRYGHSYLRSTKKIICDKKESEKIVKRIILVSHDAHFNGAQILALNIARYLKERFKYEVYIILKSGGALEEEFKKYGSVFNISREYKNLQALIDNLYALNVRVAICNTVVCGDIVKIISEKGIKALALVHELPWIINSYGLVGSLDNIFKYAHKVIYPSDFVRKKVDVNKLVPEDRIRIMPQGLFNENSYENKKEEARTILRNMLKLPQTSKIALGVGYGDYRKGVDLFVDVAKHMQNLKQDMDIYFIWIGSIEKTMIPKVVNKIDKVIFLEPVKDLSLYYSGADIFLLTSREDPFPSVVLEAMNARLPVLAFEDAGGYIDIVSDDTGGLVKYKDTKKMAEKLISLLKNKELTIEKGDTGYELIKNNYSFMDYIYSLLEEVGHSYKKISAVVLNYNYERYIRERMDSVINQSYPIYQYLVLDDCSSDNSLDIIREYKSKYNVNFVIVKNEVNSGSVFKQWIKAFEESTGDYIWIAECDDVCQIEFLEEVMKGFVKEDVVLSYCQSKPIDDRGNCTAQNYCHYTDDINRLKWKSDYANSGIDEIKTAMVVKNTIPNISASVFKRLNIEDIGSELVKFRVAGDWYFYIWILSQGNISYVCKELNMHRRHAKSVTSKEDRNIHYEEIIKIQDYIMSKFLISDQTKKLAYRYREQVKKILKI